MMASASEEDSEADLDVGCAGGAWATSAVAEGSVAFALCLGKVVVDCVGEGCKFAVGGCNPERSPAPTGDNCMLSTAGGGDSEVALLDWFRHRAIGLDTAVH